MCSNGSHRQPAQRGPTLKEIAVTLTVDTPAAEAVYSRSDTPDRWSTAAESTPAPEAQARAVPAADKPKSAPAKKAPGKKTKTLELTLTVTGTADGEWRAELKQGSTYLARNLAVAAAAVSRAAEELHEDLFTPIEGLIEEARSQQAVRVATLEAELEAARKVLAELD
jgi:hypothetical protein